MADEYYYRVEFSDGGTRLIKGKTKGGSGKVVFCCTATVRDDKGGEIVTFGPDEVFGYGDRRQLESIVSDLFREWLADQRGVTVPHPDILSPMKIRTDKRNRSPEVFREAAQAEPKLPGRD
jgi:hypothetical protein